MSVTADEIAEITNLVWESVLEARIESSPGAADLAGDRAIGAQVQISGAWQGRVAVECPPELARALTATLLMIESAEVDEEQIRDAVGELANMIGGNLKSLLPGPSKLGLPEDVAAETPEHPWASKKVTFEYEGQPFVVSVSAEPAS